MKFKTNKKEYDLYIGLAFVKELDMRYQQNFAGVEFGHGVAKVFLGLTQYNPIAFADYVLAATITEDTPPTLKEIEETMLSWSPEDITKYYDDFLDALAENSLTRAQVGQIAMTQMMIEARAMQDKEDEKKLQRGRIEN